MSNLSAQDYLQKRVKVIFEPIVSSMLAEKPKEPVYSPNSDSIYD
jgi:hypothetical protein